MMPPELLTRLWNTLGFRPSEEQVAAILHGDGPLFLPAGPGAGKSRVLIWRAVNLIAVCGVPAEKLFLATFTEKAARQLRDGVRSMLALVTESTGQPVATGGLYVGTVHSLCRRLVNDRRENNPPALLDDLGQYLFLRRPWIWQELVNAAGGDDYDNTWINEVFGSRSKSRHVAIAHCAALFNRLTDECLSGDEILRQDRVGTGARNSKLTPLIRMYQAYRKTLERENQVDFAALQERALHELAESGPQFEHVIVDEYQDTNAIQERLFFQLARPTGNLCVVGDDDQALYRFRGATVENLVEFPARCRRELGVEPRRIVLATNYRSRELIVGFSNRFMSSCDWREGGLFGDSRSYRIEGKEIQPSRKLPTRQDAESQAGSVRHGPAVVASAPGTPDDVCREIAGLVRRLLDAAVVDDPNQIAFLFPSLKSKQVPRMRHALADVGLPVYAPRAGRFVEVDEARAVWGILLKILGRPERGSPRSQKYVEFEDWVDKTAVLADSLIADDERLAGYVQRRRADVMRSAADFRQLSKAAEHNGWDLSAEYDPRCAAGLRRAAVSPTAAGKLSDPHVQRLVAGRRRSGRPLSLRYVFNRVTALPWTVLDVFYELCGARHSYEMFERARGSGSPPAAADEGPLCNLALVSQYLGRFVEEFHWLLTGERLVAQLSRAGRAPGMPGSGEPGYDSGGWYARALHGFLYALYRRGESEYEDANDPFPRGRIPFITVHQAKGLEFPVVVLGNLRKNEQPQPLERLVQPLLRRDGEPIGRQGKFDAMRLFYVALTRAQELVVLPEYQGPGQTAAAPFSTLLPRLPRIADVAVASSRREEKLDGQSRHPEATATYSYTRDYVPYRQCPRKYYLFRKTEFTPARAQPMFFGRLVHESICSLHRELIRQRAAGTATPCVDDDWLGRLCDAAHEWLQAETGSFLLAEVRQVALRQVQMYWRKLPHVATAVTEPEVRLHLPNQHTPQGRPFSLEGVVDVVADDRGVTLYDVKTCGPDELRANWPTYRGQLAVYAHVWNGLHPARPVNRAAIISTALPGDVNAAAQVGNEDELRAALSAWDPLIPVSLTDNGMQAALDDFGRVVDGIEAGQFEPPAVEVVASCTNGLTFARQVCGTCDVRYSCPSYRAYVESDRSRVTRFGADDDPWRHDAGLADDGRPGEPLASHPLEV